MTERSEQVERLKSAVVSVFANNPNPEWCGFDWLAQMIVDRETHDAILAKCAWLKEQREAAATPLFTLPEPDRFTSTHDTGDAA